MSDFIPDGLVADILSRLPTKSLIRFRSVSKLWNSIITNPTFINSQLTHSLTSRNSFNDLPLVIVSHCDPNYVNTLKHHKLFIDAGDEEIFDEYLEIPFPLKSLLRYYYVLKGYAKGLFCVLDHDKYFLWNPSIRKCITIPKPGIEKKLHGVETILLGFGFDKQSNDHKVVRAETLGGIIGSEAPLVEVYSLNAGFWKINSGAGASFPLGFCVGYSECFPVCLEGAIHWAGYATGFWNDRLILSFDLVDEVFKTTLLPNYLGGASTEIRTSVFEGQLCLLCDDHAYKSCSIWIMKEYGVVDSWYKYVKVDLTNGIERVVGIRKNGHILLEENQSDSSLGLSSYDPSNKEIKKLEICGRMGHFHVDTYEENLVLLDKNIDPVSGREGSRERKHRSTLDQSIHARMEAQTVLATDFEGLKHECTVLEERIGEKIEVAHEVVAKLGPQQFASSAPNSR